MARPPIRRTLVPHTRVHRAPEVVLKRMLARVEAGLRDGEEWLETEDGPVDELQRRVAALLGTEAALFFPSGTMAQQVALRVHAERRGRPTFTAHPTVHLDLWEDRGYSAVHGLRFLPAGDANEPLTADALAAVPERLAAVVWELPQREIGGVLPEWDDLRAQVQLARDRGAAAHLDGARLWEAQPFYDRPHAEIAGLFDTVYVSLYKGLGGVRGAVLAGDAETIGEAGVWRTRLGGALPDAWPLALAALDGLESGLPRMAAHRDHAVAIAAAISARGRGRPVPDPPQSPMFHLHLPAPRADVRRAGAELLAETGVQLFSWVASQPDPSRCAVEVFVGESAHEFAPEEVADLVDDVLERAARAS